MNTSTEMNTETIFNIDKEKAQFKVERSFTAPLDKVWAAWTEASLLDQWWAPIPYKAITKSMDFRQGGTWLYSMKGPEGDQHFCRADYSSINSKKSYIMQDCFCDENGIPNKEVHPGSKWFVEFSENKGHTTVHVTIQYAKFEDLEKIMALGMKEGFGMAIDNLVELLS